MIPTTTWESKGQNDPHPSGMDWCSKMVVQAWLDTGQECWSFTPIPHVAPLVIFYFVFFLHPNVGNSIAGCLVPTTHDFIPCKVGGIVPFLLTKDSQYFL